MNIFKSIKNIIVTYAGRKDTRASNTRTSISTNGSLIISLDE